jgi:formylglycine-generating enzyme required for sulfatase activity
VYEKPRDNSKRVYRGGSWDDSYTLAPKRQREYVERATRRFRNLPTIRGPMVGVRCAKSV